MLLSVAAMVLTVEDMHTINARTKLVLHRPAPFVPPVVWDHGFRLFGVGVSTAP